MGVIQAIVFTPSDSINNREMKWKQMGERKYPGAEIMTPVPLYCSVQNHFTILQLIHGVKKKIDDIRCLGTFRRPWLSPWTAAPRSCGPPGKEAEKVYISFLQSQETQRWTD